MIEFWLPIGIGEVEVIIPPAAETMLLRLAVHEIGHAEVVSHFVGTVLGIAFQHRAEGMIAHAIYKTPVATPLGDRCTIVAAGSAAEALVYGSYGTIEASGDRKDVAALDGKADYDAYIEKAK
jgi:hypothetical protein